MPYDALAFWVPVVLGGVNVVLNLRLQISLLKQQRWVKRLFMGHLKEHHDLKVESLMGEDGDE